MSRILGTKDGKEVQLEFGNVPFLQRAEIASKIANDKPISYNYIWCKTMAESSILTPYFSKEPQELWKCDDETIEKIFELMAEKFDLKRFLGIILGKEYKTEK